MGRGQLTPSFDDTGDVISENGNIAVTWKLLLAIPYGNQNPKVSIPHTPFNSFPTTVTQI